LQRTGISVPLIDNLLHDAVVSRPLKAGVMLLRLRNGKYRIHPTSLTVMVVVIAALCSACETFSQSASSFARFKRVRYIRSETRRDVVLEKAILRSLPSYREEIRRIHEYDPSVVPTYIVRYFYNRVDLNDDRKPETLVWLHSAMLGGSSGYTAQIYRSEKEGYNLLWEGTPAWNPVIVSGRKTRGWRNLIMLVGGGGVRPGYWIEVRFDGQSYSSSPRGGVEIKKSRIAGRAFIADDWWSGFKGIELQPPGPDVKLRGTSMRQHNKALQLTAR
jgi:hypothetical protein